VLSSTIDGKQYAIPYTYYQWGIYYNRDAYKAAGVDLPAEGGVSWDRVLGQLRKVQGRRHRLRDHGLQALWPVAGIFDYVSMRTNGYQFHSDLAAGKISWTSPEVAAVFAEFGQAAALRHRKPCGHRLAGCGGAFVQGKAANYVMGNFAVGVFKEGGMTMTTSASWCSRKSPLASPRRRSADRHRPPDLGRQEPEDAKTFLAYIATAEAQTKWNGAVGQLPTNKNATWMRTIRS
jgi:multiple sugar transport system substrate-binding protein